jgi:hypothetical protein
MAGQNPDRATFQAGVGLPEGTSTAEIPGVAGARSTRDLSHSRTGRSKYLRDKKDTAMLIAATAIDSA